MQAEARRFELYHGAVTFTEVLIEKLKKQKRNNRKLKIVDGDNCIDYEFLWRSQICLNKTLQMLEGLRWEHDKVLLEKGPKGQHHKCNYEPFDENYINEDARRKVSKLDMTKYSSYRNIKDRYQLKQAHIDKEEVFKDYIAYHAALDENANLLCKKKQLMVGIFNLSSLYQNIALNEKYSNTNKLSN